MQYQINPDIKKSETLPGSFYRDKQVFEDLKEKIFIKSWHLVENCPNLTNESAFPFTLLKGFLDEPLILTKDEEGEIHCLSNVCTHRANLIVDKEKSCKNLICRYHGRKFNLKGRFEYMPEFQNAEGFPREEDNLKSFSIEKLGPMIFASPEPSFDLKSIFKKIEDRLEFLPLQDLEIRPELSKKYNVKANWALYCDNYLEGFHIPFVHKGLNEILDFKQYEIELEDHFNVQIGITNNSQDGFNFPKGHQDHGRNIAAYYYWIFPNFMLNFYPWGLSVNIVKPVKIDQTEVHFYSYVLDESKLNLGAGSGLNNVEMEDEEVVQSVQLGVGSRYYKTGRFSPGREKGVHHFHQLLAHLLNK